MLFVVFRLSTTGDISKLSHICVTILKYHSWYLSQIPLEIVLFPILIGQCTRHACNWTVRVASFCPRCCGELC